MRNLLLKKKNGSTGDFIFPVYLLLFAAVFFLFVFTMKIISFTRTTVEDGLVASTLASAWFQAGENTNELKIDDARMEEYYNIFVSSLKENLMLDDSLTPKPGTATDSLICSPITIESYIFYTVRNGKVYKISRTAAIDTESLLGDVGRVTAPDGTYIYEPTIYSKVSFWIVNQISKEKKEIEKECVVDIAKNTGYT